MLARKIQKNCLKESSQKELLKELSNVKKERNSLKRELEKCLSKVSHFSTRNVNKRINTQKKKKVAILKDEGSVQSQKIKDLEAETSDLNEQLELALKKGLRARKSKSHWKCFVKNTSIDENKFSQSYVDELNEQIAFLQNQKLELEEKLDIFMKKEVSFFHNGKYDDSIPAVYQDLLCMGLSTRNVQKVIKIVLKDLLGIDAVKLPGSTFSNYMLLEARYVAQIHVADELCKTFTEEDPQQNTLHSDGTSKKGHGYMTYDINKADGTTLVAGLRSIGGGDAQTQLITFQEVINDLSETSVLAIENSNFVSNVFYSIKNLMSDRCGT